MDLKIDFTNLDEGIRKLFNELEIEINKGDDKPLADSDVRRIITEKVNIDDNKLTKQIENKKLYFYGSIDDDDKKVFVFRIAFKENSLKDLPKKRELIELTRILNRAFPKHPVLVVFNYSNSTTKATTHITLAVAERLEYKQQGRTGIRIGKISMLRDIDVHNTHAGHKTLLLSLKEKQAEKANNLYENWCEVFSIDLLNKNFYREIKTWFDWAEGEIIYPDTANSNNNDTNKQRHLIRLLTRILFTWFMKEKNLVPVKFFNQSEVQKILKESAWEEDKSVYYKAILQNLFFATLNQVPLQRQFRSDKNQMNINNLWRYKKYFINPDTLSNLTAAVPFMNGGLFEALDKPHPEKKGRKGGDVIIYSDGFSDREDNKLLVPNQLFFGDNSQHKGLLRILESYKFTLSENTPIEEEVALDPDLLGRIFENLLACLNTETSETARKASGSFYTPREIVDFMVNESLLSYLRSYLIDKLFNKKLNPNIAENLTNYLQNLLSYDQTDEVAFTILKEEEAAENSLAAINTCLIAGLDECTILDPACGSGAFPMGILQKMTHLLGKVDPHNVEWKQRQLDSANNITDSPTRDNTIDDIEKAFANNDLDYGRKLYLIENCIFGVDKEPIAIQISKLRFFISLVIEQKASSENIGNAEKNFGIKALPNLETQFITANTLHYLDPEEKHTQLSLITNYQHEITELQNQLKKVRNKLFNARTPQDKRDLRADDKELRQKLGAMMEKAGLKHEIAQRLAEWDPFNLDKVSTWFEHKWMFGTKNDFAIVIGNPPYIQLQKNDVFTKEEKALLQKTYKKTYAGSGDIYALFYERAHELLQENGKLVLITSNKWMRAGYGEALRTFILNDYHIDMLLDLTGEKIFEATVDTVIVSLTKIEPTKATHTTEQRGAIARSLGLNIANLSALQIKQLTQNTANFQKIIRQESHILKGEAHDVFLLMSEHEANLKTKIKTIGTPLNDWAVKINRGVVTGYNPAFIIDKAKRDQLIAADPSSAQIIKPLLRGKDVKRYSVKFAEKYLIATFPAVKINIDKYPAVKNYLQSFGKTIHQTGEQGTRTKTQNKWFEIQIAVAYYRDFQKEKIVYSEMVQSPQFYWDKTKFYILDTVFLLTGEHIKYLLALLNSKITAFFFKKYYAGGGLGEKGYRYKKAFLVQLPIPHPEKIAADKKPLCEKLVALAEQMTELHNQSPLPKREIADCDAQIDKLVADLYELTEAERAWLTTQ